MTTLPYGMEEAPSGFSDESSHPAPALEEAEGEQVVVHIFQPSPEWVTSVVARMEELVSLHHGWAGEGTVPPGLQVAAHALEVLSAWSEPTLASPQVVPTHEGGIQLEWHERGLDFEVEVEPSLDVEVLFYDNESSEEWDGALSEHLDDVRRAIGRLSG